MQHSIDGAAFHWRSISMRTFHAFQIFEPGLCPEWAVSETSFSIQLQPISNSPIEILCKHSSSMNNHECTNRYSRFHISDIGRRLTFRLILKQMTLNSTKNHWLFPENFKLSESLWQTQCSACLSNAWTLRVITIDTFVCLHLHINNMENCLHWMLSKVTSTALVDQ